ncbi:hypothetical protein SADUNF_Sadunf10G0073100 [Salix dunnii]|uniref:GAG-pre-integrase domain-containing protein n=1 Tax=Salix dunnii TaxID=1413687 RepID=A0A835MUG6_9ROSI|nr:hypothetical protein SADUNF_Sadunf10G0073100 [Salix dunnii]
MTTLTSSSSSVSSTSSSLPISLAALTNNFSTHLNADNYLLWRDQITPLLICNDLYGHIDGTDPPPSKTIINDGTISPNPDYARWFKIDQLVVGGIKNKLSSTACAEVLGKHVAKDVWDTLETLFHQQTLSRADILHDTLLDTYKNDMSIETYLAKIKGIADQLAAISQPVPDIELLERIRGRATPPLAPLSHHALNFRGSSASILGQYPTHHSPSFADLSNKPFNNNVQHGKNRFHTGNNSGNRSQFGRSCYRGRCQICKQEGHSASNCNYCYTRPNSNNSDNLFAQFAGVHVSDLTAPTEGSLDCVSSHWLGDTGATNHMASNTDLVQQPLPFNGTSGVYVGNGESLCISHIGNSSIHLGSKSLSLNDILVDLATGVILLKGPVKDNLYPIPAHALSTAFRKLSCNSAIACITKTAPCSTWHRRLGHPGSKILRQLSVVPIVALQSTAYQSLAATKAPLAIAFEPLLSHSSSMSDPPTASAHQMEPSSSATPTTSSIDFSHAISSNACVSTPPAAPIISNNHPMITRAKDGIHKPRALCLPALIPTGSLQ